MALSVFRYSAVNTKARALFSKLLDKNDYEELLGKNTVQDIAAYLKKSTEYGSLLSAVNTSLVHRGELEKLFKVSLYEDYIKFLHFIGGNPAEFIKAAFIRYEIEDLKMLIRVIYTGRDSESVKESLLFLKKYSGLDFEKLVESVTVPQLINSLKGTEYYKVLAPFADSSKTQNLFDIEMSLDLHFFMTVLKLKDKLLSGEDRDSVNHTFGLEIDLMNIMMIYRCRKLFNFPRELTLKYVIPHWHRLTREQLVRLIESRDVDEFKRLIQKTPYAEVFSAEEEHLWETNINNYMHHVHLHNLRGGSFSIGTLTAYLHLKEMDIKNIIALIEGVRYSLPKEEIRSYLIGIKK